MAALTQQSIQLDNLSFQSKLGAPLIIKSASLKFETNNDDVVECRLQLEITPEQYQHIEQNQHFNLTPEIKGPHTGSSFQPDHPILLTVTLKPDLLPTLLNQAPTAEAAVSYLSTLSQQQTTPETTAPSEVTPLLHTEDWLCLSVKQSQENETVGFTTFWHSINPALINNPNTTSDQLAEGIVNFVKDWTEVNLAEATQTATTQFLQGITETFGDLLDDTLATLTEDEAQDNTSKDSLCTSIIDFFEQENWPFVKIDDSTALRLNFRGENGQWSCYTKVNEDQQTFLFYSICPIPSPESKRPAIAEFITRANYGMIIGNFELDYSDGEIRYKTSIDVEGSILNLSLIKQLVYTNVLTMDQYLPGILAVLEEEVEPERALGIVE